MQTDGTFPDSSGNGRDGSGTNLPVYKASQTPSAYIASACHQLNGADASGRRLNIGNAATWNALIGTSGTGKVSISAWVRKTGDGGNDYGRIIDFGTNDIVIYTGTTEKN